MFKRTIIICCIIFFTTGCLSKNEVQTSQNLSIGLLPGADYVELKNLKLNNKYPVFDEQNPLYNEKLFSQVSEIPSPANKLFSQVLYKVYKVRVGGIANLEVLIGKLIDKSSTIDVIIQSMFPTFNMTEIFNESTKSVENKTVTVFTFTTQPKFEGQSDVHPSVYVYAYRTSDMVVIIGPTDTKEAAELIMGFAIKKITR
jgi:hypothetical protein